jgi:hypothetical protein
LTLKDKGGNKKKNNPGNKEDIVRKTGNAVEKNDKSFEFKNALSIIKSTGRKAATLRELRDNIDGVSEECIFHHTYQYFTKGLISEYTSDFAEWIGVSLEESALAEHLSNTDLFSYTSIEDLRDSILKVIDYYLMNFPEPRPALRGNEFYFTETVSFIFPAGLRARNLAEFYMALKYLDSGSIYYHFFEARVRLGKGEDDFTKWLDEVIGAHGVVNRVRSIDPFMHNIETIRERLVRIVEEELKAQMEVI